MPLKRIGISLGAIAALIIAVNLALHFGQKTHDRLDYDVEKAFPPGKPFVPGEIYATTLAEIMDHELHTGFGWRPNDFFLWGPHLMADNNANRQLGIIMAVRETMRSMSEKVSYRRKLWLCSVNPIHNRPPCCFRSRAREQSSISAPRVACSPPTRSRASDLTSMQPPAAPAVECRVSRTQAGG